jgi:hypothetical protein
LVEVAEPSDANFAGFQPSEALAIGRDGDLRDGAATIKGGEDFVEPG